MSYKCEFYNETTKTECRRPAISEWRAIDEDEREVYSTFRCERHPELYFDEERVLDIDHKHVDDLAAVSFGNMFYESFKPLNTVLAATSGTQICAACGVEYDDDDINAYAHAKARC